MRVFDAISARALYEIPSRQKQQKKIAKLIVCLKNFHRQGNRVQNLQFQLIFPTIFYAVVIRSDSGLAFILSCVCVCAINGSYQSVLLAIFITLSSMRKKLFASGRIIHKLRHYFCLNWSSIIKLKSTSSGVTVDGSIKNRQNDCHGNINGISFWVIEFRSLYCGSTQKESISIDYPLSIVSQIHRNILDRLIKIEFFPPENDSFNDVSHLLWWWMVKTNSKYG